MMCGWKELVEMLPAWIQEQLRQFEGKAVQEIRLRLGKPPELVLEKECFWLSGSVSSEDLSFVVSVASRYSPWAAASTGQGYLAGKAGHRIGLCGEVTVAGGEVTGIGVLSSLCIRVARDVCGISDGIDPAEGSILILGPPGWGKSTLLRDLVRRISRIETVCVVDTRKELFPAGFTQGKRMDILSGCPKSQGISMAIRTMGPAWVAVDEITEETDCRALVRAGNCGVNLVATAHAGCLQELYRRNVYRELLEEKVFRQCVLLRKDRTFTVERMAYGV